MPKRISRKFVVCALDEKVLREEIVDEQCTCGHRKSFHSVSPFSSGHGRCLEVCNCKQFTWAGFVKLEVKDV